MLEHEAHIFGFRENAFPFSLMGSPQQMQIAALIAANFGPSCRSVKWRLGALIPARRMSQSAWRRAYSAAFLRVLLCCFFRIRRFTPLGSRT